MEKSLLSMGKGAIFIVARDTSTCGVRHRLQSRRYASQVYAPFGRSG
ncbi:MAG: hypothetical protein IIA60_13700 [Candidatus Marinimicrobia bacterium]|nr:hypothetical protein [Candidatus Neomarinimicrobiota bacterium]